MHTDEYEISIAREINHCEQVVKNIKATVQKRVQQYGMNYEEAARTAAEGSLSIPAKELAAWREDIEALPVWEQRLKEYREALAVMRISASRF